MKYIIQSRYETITSNGKIWTPWNKEILSGLYKTEEECKEIIKKYKESVKQIDKITHLKHEYKYELIDVRTLPMPKPHFKHRGRPSKAELEAWNKRLEEYLKELDS